MLMDASFSVGFTYGYSWCPASRDATQCTELTEGGSYLSANGALPPAALPIPSGDHKIAAAPGLSHVDCQISATQALHLHCGSYCHNDLGRPIDPQNP
ncbi:hypothetical protein SBA2_680013 [Acidobacteriia bacterium SbA2]|nr:hypothetical protein SBA2_680013 [Acidobacteriia bacterium SbA2]